MRPTGVSRHRTHRIHSVGDGGSPGLAECPRPLSPSAVKAKPEAILVPSAGLRSMSAAKDIARGAHSDDLCPVLVVQYRPRMTSRTA
jgi:hypothetical protein